MNTNDIESLALRLWSSCGIVRTNKFNVSAFVSDAQPNHEVTRYFACLPEKDVIIHGVRFMDPQSVMMENTELIPGCFITPHGFVAFASLESGEVFAIELSSGEIYLLPTEKYESADTISPGWNETRTDFLPDLPMTAENIKGTASVTFDSIRSFLTTSLTDHRS